MKQLGWEYSNMLNPRTGNKMTQQEYEEIVAKDPAYVVMACIPEREEWLPLWLSVPHMTVAGDQMPPTDKEGKKLAWDDPYEAYVGHPRTAGSHAATLRLAREHKVPLLHMIASNSYWSAKHLGDAGMKMMQERGRIQEGMVADITVFDSETVTDNSTYKVGSNGSAAMDLPNDAVLGAGIGGMVGEKMYVQAGFVDANSDPAEFFSDVWKENDFFKWVEIGFTPGQESLYFDKLHLTFWHMDERANGTPDGWGLNASWQQWIDDKWLPFVRGGYTEDSGSLLEESITIGVGYQPVPMRGVIGIGLNWGKPNQVSFEGADDQYTAELFWRYQLTKEIAVTPSIQYIKDPALNPDEDSLWAFGLRLRVVL